jgi:membrane protein YdbS with pleckstrin-like domain
MKTHVEQASRWIYGGVWGVLVRWFRVPAAPPTLPAVGGQPPQSFRPAPGFLKYLKLQFWFTLSLIFAGELIAAGAVALESMAGAVALFVPVAVPAVLLGGLAYIALHLRYDTTWYVMSERSLRIRRGIWVIRETTITFENVQNIKIDQGPLQRLFGVANVLVQTAGGGGGQAGQHGQAAGGGQNHLGLIEGVADAPRIRDLILARLRQAQTTGLGDEHEPHPPEAGGLRKAGWGPVHLALLTQVRDAARRLAG